MSSEEIDCVVQKVDAFNDEVHLQVAIVRGQVHRDVFDGDGRSRSGCVGGSQHDCVCARRQGSHLLADVWTAHDSE